MGASHHLTRNLKKRKGGKKHKQREKEFKSEKIGI
jgi:hypothetical protein